ncbi:MAG: glycosyltransferase family 2 protein [Ornithinibacter sp.]
MRAQRTATSRRPRALLRRLARKLDLGPDQDRRRTAEDRHAMARIRAGVVLPRRLPRPRHAGSVWAVTMVKDEDDIIGRVVEHLLRQGVSHLLVSDNGSTDDTVGAVRRVAGSARLTVVNDPVREFFQSLKMTHLSRYAWRQGADWLLPFDADEFWFGADGRLTDVLAGLTGDVVEARVHNVFPSREHGWVLDTVPHAQGKVCFRSDPDAVLTQGNHSVHHPAGPPADRESLVLLHVPWRSREQLGRKLVKGALAYEGTGSLAGMGSHWPRFAGVTPERAQEVWDAICRGEPVDDLAWNPVGTLVPIDLDAALRCDSWAQLRQEALG